MGRIVIGSIADGVLARHRLEFEAKALTDPEVENVLAGGGEDEPGGLAGACNPDTYALRVA